MIIANPYNTTYGNLITTSNIEKELTKYLITTKLTNLNYEYTRTEIPLVFITGCTEEEKNLPMFTHPLVFNNIKEQPHIAIDLRKYVRSIKEQPLTVGEIFKDSSSCDYLITSSIVMSDFLVGKYADYREILNDVTIAYAMFLSYIISVVVMLDPAEKYKLELGCSYFCNLLQLPNERTNEYIDSIISRIANSKLSLPSSFKTVETVIKEIDISGVSLDYSGLIHVIKQCLPEEKADLINDTVLVNMFSNLWYGPGSNESIIIGMECMPIWIAVVYSCLNDNSYKRTKLANILNKYNKNIDGNDLIKRMQLIIKSKKDV